MGVQTKKFPGSATATTNQESESLSNDVTAISKSIVNQFTEQIYVRARGRQMALTIESTGSGVAWQLGTPRADIRPDGRRG